MKTIITMCLLVACVAQAIASDKKVDSAMFKVQHHDIGVTVLGGSIDVKASATAGHPVITGCHVTIALQSDFYEMAAAPQCHWDGVSEKTRYAYTLTMKSKGDTTGQLITYSINLMDFTAIHQDDTDKIRVFQMGVLPNDGYVKFVAGKFRPIDESTNLNKFYVESPEEKR